ADEAPSYEGLSSPSRRPTPNQGKSRYQLWPDPGLWMLHCHNQYHSESGMMTLLGYLK
ncbi:multicopper oxidase domain-containing protein, partial [Streptomyces sp. NPDC049099]|uniref:multicopper oxidase domain-containing protein n=1 Tax=Streptomyces sp. NPDC049099 TaxID=3155768 RepID=UPI003415F2E3